MRGWSLEKTHCTRWGAAGPQGLLELGEGFILKVAGNPWRVTQPNSLVQAITVVAALTGGGGRGDKGESS